MADVKTPLAAVREFFGMKMPDMKSEWMASATKPPTPDEKNQLQDGCWKFYQEFTEAEQAQILDSRTCPPELMERVREIGALTY